MKKSLVLAMALALGVTASAYAANPFSDVPAGHWAYDSVNKLASAGIVDGYGNGTFGGDRLMTRYEMAQIVAKAMAKGANVDRLAAEFADELDSLGVRVAALEKKSDNVKITGQVRARYVSRDNTGYSADLRSRLWVTGQVNDDWTYTAMLQNVQDFKNNGGDDKLDLNRAYVDGNIAGASIRAGRWDEVTFTGNVLDSYMDAAKFTVGNKVKVFGIAAKGADDGDTITDLGRDRVYVGGIEGRIGGLDAYVGYFKADTANEKEIWNVGAAYSFGNDFVLSAEYMRGDKNYAYGGKKPGKDGWAADLAWKGAEASKPGSYGLHVGYFDQSANAFLAPTTDATTFIDEGGYKGWAVGASYTFAKNIVGVINYYDTESQTTSADDKVIFSELYFTF